MLLKKVPDERSYEDIDTLRVQGAFYSRIELTTHFSRVRQVNYSTNLMELSHETSTVSLSSFVNYYFQ